jgi:hypothetical protein
MKKAIIFILVLTVLAILLVVLQSQTGLHPKIETTNYQHLETSI